MKKFILRRLRYSKHRYIPAVEVQVESVRTSVSDFDEEARQHSADLMHHTSGVRITPPSPSRFTPWTAMGDHYDPPSHASAPDLAFPSLASDSETVCEEIQGGGMNITEYVALHPEEPRFYKATQTDIYDFNSLRQGDPSIPRALITLEDLPVPADTMPDHLLKPRHFVMFNEAKPAFYLGMEVESFGTLKGNWTLAEVKLRQRGFVYVQWVEQRKKQLAVIRMAENSYHTTSHLHQQERGSRRRTKSSINRGDGWVLGRVLSLDKFPADASLSPK
ncbi:hypothetical protein C8R47DRAFT_1069264 [Mycena vitilis]|nr:hypothetical protein C8R47DRAFT_1069264 [Mycena vitilis]